MRKILIFLLGIWLGSGLPAAEVSVRIETPDASPGDPVMISFTSSDGRPEITNFPALSGGRWVRSAINQSSSTQIINGRASTIYTSIYTVVPEKPGELVIPAFTLQINGEPAKAPEQRINVVPARERRIDSRNGAEQVKLSDIVFGRFVFPDGRREFFLGEEVPFELRLYVRPGNQVRILEYPAVEIEHAIFRDYRKQNPESGQFARPGAVERRTFGNQSYQTLTFRSAFRSLAAGTVKPSASIRVGLEEQSARRRSLFDDEFFDNFFDRGRQLKPYTVDFEQLEELRFKPLPAVPEGVHFLGLIGWWDLVYSFDLPDEARVGEVLTLKIRLEGLGGTETLAPPPLNLPGFRCYPPEVKVSEAGDVEITYTLIPLRDGEAEIRLKLAVFDPESGQYQSFPFERKFTVKPSDRPLSGSAAGEIRSPATSPEPENTGNDDIFYLKKAPSGPVTLPLWRRTLLPALLLAAAGPLLWGASLLFFRRFGDTAGKRRRRLRRELRRKVRELQPLEPAEFAGRVNSELLPLLCEYLRLPPGLTAAELAERIDREDLAAALRELGHQHFFRPGGGIDAAGKRKFLQGLKPLLLLLLLLHSPLPAAAGPWAEGREAYDRGDFESARQFFAGALVPGRPDAALAFNLGCAEYMLQDYPAALASFELARRLRPHDSAALENLNLARRRLGLPEEGRLHSPAGLLLFGRDLLRPDQWLPAAGAAGALLFLFLAFRGRKSGNPRPWAGLTGLAVVALAVLTVVVSQYHGPYSGRRAVVLGRGAELKTLPAELGRREGELPAGREVRIVEERPDYCLVRFGRREGWLRTDAIRKIWR